MDAWRREAARGKLSNMEILLTAAVVGWFLGCFLGFLHQIW